MALHLSDYEHKTREAIQAFWGNRETARAKQREAGKADQGERAGVTAGKNMDGFLVLVQVSFMRTVWNAPRLPSGGVC